MTQDETWPAYDLRTVHEHVHAIGVLSDNFNGLENELLSFLKMLDGAPESVVSFLFEKVSNETRLDWLLRLVSAKNPDPQHLQDCIVAFAKAYKICADNRNLIVHSRINAYFAPADKLMLSKRVRKHGEEKHHELTLKIIRRVADEIRAWHGFGHHVLWFVLRRQRAARHRKYGRQGGKLVGPTTLPEIPSLPAILVA